MDIPGKYNPAPCEEKWYKFWLAKNYFHSEPDKKKKPCTVVIPPPNVTGCLHMGHALNNVVQDVLIRFRRMQGYNALWMPGTDHGGIATQNIVERKLLEEGTDRHALGREKFLEYMWRWRRETGDTILEQLKKMGCSCDWARTRFTMDEVCTNAVMEAFITLYDKGLIYRGNYMVNWCPRCRTALSEIEVEHEEKNGKLWYIRYPLKKNPSSAVTVATTRPETMLGDTAVAVNPQDKRYMNLVGETVILPIMEREIPVVADEFVDPAFGTGAVKVTPSHDPNDFEIAKRHNLNGIKVIDEEGRMTEEAKAYRGMDRFACREKLLGDLKAKGFFVKEEDYAYSIGQCYRCASAVEPLVSEQWYLRMKDMAEMGISAVEKGRVSFVPERWKEPYLKWLENLHDWCISRQIWWGHRMPVWYCPNSSRSQKGDCPPIASASRPGRCPNCKSTEFIQDPDVLDTWFSSALWPFSTLGWPEKTEELKYYYPTSVLATAHEILYLWVARMIMMGMAMMKDIPFSTVYIHGMVRDSKGKKMSKSLGNVVDPLDSINKYGADALRFGLSSSSVMGRDLQISEGNFESARNFANKIWNASRFVMMNLEGYEYQPLDKEPLELMNAWIIDEYNKTVKEISSALEEYDISKASRLAYDFIWSKYCDWYLELAKTRFYGEGIDKKKRLAAQNVLVEILEGTLKLLHPVMPFITEEIWQRLKEITGKKGCDSIMISPWPEPLKIKIDKQSVRKMHLIIDMVSKIRNIRSEFNVPPAEILKEVNIYGDSIYAEILRDRECLGSLWRLARIDIKRISYSTMPPDRPEKGSAMALLEEGYVHVPLVGLIDVGKEAKRLEKEIQNINNELERINGKLDNRQFLANAPRDVVEDAKRRKKEGEEKRKKLRDNLDSLK